MEAFLAYFAVVAVGMGSESAGAAFTHKLLYV